MTVAVLAVEAMTVSVVIVVALVATDSVNAFTVSWLISVKSVVLGRMMTRGSRPAFCPGGLETLSIASRRPNTGDIATVAKLG